LPALGRIASRHHRVRSEVRPARGDEEDTKRERRGRAQSASAESKLHKAAVPITLLPGVKLKRLQVAVLNAGCARGNVHPAATTCVVALTQTPWFRSRATVPFCGLSLVSSPVEVDVVQAKAIRAGGLEERIDVLVVPGGSSAQDVGLLGAEGLAAVRAFVEKGGGYCGICAGAYLALHGWRCSEGPGLGLVAARLHRRRRQPSESPEPPRLPDPATGRKNGLRRRHQRGLPPCIVDVRLSKLGRQLLWDEALPASAEPEEWGGGVIRMRFHNGPVLAVPRFSKARVLGQMWFDSETGVAIAKDGCASRDGHHCSSSAPAPQLELSNESPPSFHGAACFVSEDIGGGRAVLISPHPESTQHEGLGHSPGKQRLQRILQRAVLLAAAGPASGRSWLESCCHLPAVPGVGALEFAG